MIRSDISRSVCLGPHLNCADMLYRTKTVCISTSSDHQAMRTQVCQSLSGCMVSHSCTFLELISQQIGGGFSEGGTPDLRYNLSFIVENSVKIGRPIIGVSTAYRLGPFGFLSGDEVVGAGLTNLGLKDQRLAMHWISMYMQTSVFRLDADNIL